MTDNQDGWAVGGGGNSFPFDNIGDYVTGEVFEYEPNLPQTDKDGKPKVWPSGQAQTMHRVGLHVIASSSPKYQPGADCSVYLKGSVKANEDGTGSTQAVVAAAIIAAMGHNRLQPGGKLTLQYVGDGVPKDRMSNPPKWYRAWYEGPAFAVGPTTPAAPGGSGPAAMPPGVGPGAATTAPTQAAQPVMPPAAAGPPSPAAATAQPSTEPVMGAPTTAGPPPGAPGFPAATPGLTPEQEAAIAAAMAQASAPAWDADPRVAPLRDKGTPDAVIRQVLGI